MKKKREDALKKAQERAEEDSKQKAEKKRANEKYAINEIMKVEYRRFRSLCLRKSIVWISDQV